MGVWGGKSSVKVLREFLIGAVDRKHGWSMRGVAVDTLAPWIVAADAKWLLDLYFALPGAVAKHEVLPLVRRLPIQAARRVLVARLRDADAVNRQAAVKAIGNMPFPDRADLLRPLRVDPDKDVRASVQLLGR